MTHVNYWSFIYIFLELQLRTIQFLVKHCPDFRSALLSSPPERQNADQAAGVHRERNVTMC